jgi:Flp pilus assembly protein TadB
MPDVLVPAAALVAGALCTGAVLLAEYATPSTDVQEWIGRYRSRVGAALHIGAARRRLARDIERAGWRESPERVALVAVAGSLCLGACGAAVSPVVAVFCAVAGCAAFAAVLNAAVAKRRHRWSEELVPLLELFTLELSGGGSALAALGSVCVQVESELANDLRRMLIASQVAGSASFEARLIEYAEEHEIAALGSLATILAASRDYGTAASQGVRALATDLRRAQRRELIAKSRRALNNVLLPAAVAVLLPFLGVLMFPAVSVLQRSLR